MVSFHQSELDLFPLWAGKSRGWDQETHDSMHPLPMSFQGLLGCASDLVNGSEPSTTMVVIQLHMEYTQLYGLFICHLPTGQINPDLKRLDIQKLCLGMDMTWVIILVPERLHKTFGPIPKAIHVLGEVGPNKCFSPLDVRMFRTCSEMVTK